MKILIFGNDESIHIKRWAEWLGKRGHEICIINLFNPRERRQQHDFYKVEIIKYNRFLPKPIRYFMAYSKTETFLKNFKPDIIHAFYAPTHGYFAGLMDKHPIIVSIMGSDLSSEGAGESIRLKSAMKYADHIIVCNGGTKEKVQSIVGSDKNVFIQHWGVDTKVFNAKRDYLFRERFFKGEGNIVLCTRSHKKNSNHPIVIEAIRLLFEKYPDLRENLFFLFAGEGSELKKHKALAVKLGVKENVVFLGKEEPCFLPTLYASSDIFLDPFYTDNYGSGEGVSLLEAMSTGLPAIVTRRPGVRGVIMDGDNGLKYDYNNPEDLMRQIWFLLEDSICRRIMGEYSKDLAREEYENETFMLNIENLYKEVLSV